MLKETRQISNLRSQDVSRKILSDLVRKNVAEFEIFHFQYATLEMFEGALNNCSLIMLKLLFNQHLPFCNVL